MLNVKLTVEETYALSLLGIGNAKAVIKDYQDVESNLRDNISKIASHVRYMNQMSYETNYKHFKSTQAIVAAVTSSINNRKYFWSHHQKVLEDTLSIGCMAEFLFTHYGEDVGEELYLKYAKICSENISLLLLTMNDQFGDE